MIATHTSAERVQKCIFNFEIYRFLKNGQFTPSSPTSIPRATAGICNPESAARDGRQCPGCRERRGIPNIHSSDGYPGQLYVCRLVARA